MKKLVLSLIVVLSFIGCSATNSRIDSSYKSEMTIITEKNQNYISKKIIRLAMEKGFEQKTLNKEMGYFQYRTPVEAWAVPMELTILVDSMEGNKNKVEMSALPANKNSLQPIAKSQVYRAVDNFIEDLNNDLK